MSEPIDLRAIRRALRRSSSSRTTAMSPISKRRDTQATSQVTLFPGTPAPRPARTPLRTVVVAGVDEDLAQVSDVPDGLVRVGRAVGIRYFVPWELSAANITARIRIRAAAPASPTRRQVARMLSGVLLEQDADGSLWLGGRLQGGGALISFCALDSEEEQMLRLGQRAGLLFGRRTDQSFVFTTAVTGHVLWVYEQPHALGPVGVFTGWVTAARHLLPSDGRDVDGPLNEAMHLDPTILKR